jgi:small-conductance mechanosensitive channel
LINIVFYFIVLCCFLAVIGIDPFALFAAITGVIVGFAFMIGGAASKYFEGVLMVLVRRPFDIGDRIAIQDPTDEPSNGGAPGWIVKDGMLLVFLKTFLRTLFCTFDFSQ